MEEKIKEELNQALKDITTRYPNYTVELEVRITRTENLN